ncbi:cytochrome P450 [Calocera viscosa TUFC12733]|uniref:Cytochrome P450 n=1 Tax=Calocera viscosa (strain TUFC12733) TaxID=1330018 RepID=A0A167QCQ4_CALVF|nr:cytochrome P450 [Calocera viscosa TUFC12733]
MDLPLPLPSLPILLLLIALYTLYTLSRPFLLLLTHYRHASRIGLPIKLLPVPPGLFSFFAYQLLLRARLARPGSPLHKILNVGRPEGYAMHEEMGDVFLTVSPSGVSCVVADPEVVGQVSNNRERFPKPPNTGAIINLYGRNVINADADVWRFHRRVTGPVFSEKIHSAVWAEGARQAGLMFSSWSSSPSPSTTAANGNTTANGTEKDTILVRTLFDDTLKLGLHVITGSAYGCPLTWSGPGSAPPTTSSVGYTYAQSVEELNKHLMPLFLTPRWLLRLAPGGSGWGRAWKAYEALGGYLRGMLERERARRQWGDEEQEEGPRENLLSVLLDAEEGGDEKLERRMLPEEVLGNAFIFMFAGHETTANTTHYALLLLALHQDVQSQLLAEIDSLYTRAAGEGRPSLSYERDYPRAVWAVALMQETLRLYTPTSVVNKCAAGDQAVTFQGREYVLPAGTRVAVNITGVHSSPKVWGEDALSFRPGRWVVPASTGSGSASNSRSSTPAPAPAPAAKELLAEQYTVLKPPRGSWLPFSEGSRMCSGRKFATVEFVSVLAALLKEHRVEILPRTEGWGEERVRRVLAGRKAGALTLQVPERVPVRFVRRK